MGDGVRNHDSFAAECADESAEFALAHRKDRIAVELRLGHRHTAHEQTAIAHRASDRGIGGRKKNPRVRHGRRDRAEFCGDRAAERRIDFLVDQAGALGASVSDGV